MVLKKETFQSDGKNEGSTRGPEVMRARERNGEGGLPVVIAEPDTQGRSPKGVNRGTRAVYVCTRERKKVDRGRTGVCSPDGLLGRSPHRLAEASHIAGRGRGGGGRGEESARSFAEQEIKVRAENRILYRREKRGTTKGSPLPPTTFREGGKPPSFERLQEETREKFVEGGKIAGRTWRRESQPT